MDHDTKHSASAIMILLIVTVPLFIGFVAFFTRAGQAPPTGAIPDPLIETEETGGVLVDEDFDGYGKNLPITVPGWSVTGDVKTWRNGYSPQNTDTKMVFNKESSVTIPLGGTTADENRKRLFVSFDYKSTIEEWHLFDSGADRFKVFPERCFTATLKSGATVLKEYDFRLDGVDDSYYDVSNNTNPGTRGRSALANFHSNAGDEIKVHADVIDSVSINARVNISFTLLGKLMGVDWFHVPPEPINGGYRYISTFTGSNRHPLFYAIYIYRHVPTDQELLDDVVRPSYFVNFWDTYDSDPGNPQGYSIFEYSGNEVAPDMAPIDDQRLRNGYYDVMARGRDKNDGGTWFVTVVPGFFQHGLMPEWKGSTSFYIPPENRDDDTNVAFSYLYPGITYDISLINHPKSFDGEIDFYDSKIDDLDHYYSYYPSSQGGKGYLPHLQTNHVTLFYDPVDYELSGAAINDGIFVDTTVTSDLMPDTLVLSTTVPSKATWDESVPASPYPEHASFARVFIDNLRVSYPNRPLLSNLEVLPSAAVGVVVGPEDTGLASEWHVHGTSNKFDVRVKARDMAPFFSTVTDVRIEHESGTTYEMHQETKLSPTSALFRATITAPPDFENGQALRYTARVRNKIHGAEDTIVFTVRLFQHDVVKPTGIEVFSGKVKLTPGFSVEIDLGTFDGQWSASVAMDPTKNSISTSTGATIGSVTKNLLPSLSGETILEYSYSSFEINITDEFGVFLELLTELSFTLSYTMEISSVSGTSYDVTLSSRFVYFVQSTDLERTISIIANRNPVEADLVDFDGLPVLVDLTDPSGELVDDPMLLRLTNINLFPEEYREREMDLVDVGTYSTIVPTSWLQDWTPGTFEMKTYIPGIIEETSSFTFEYDIPYFSVESPVGVYGIEDTLELVIDPVDVFDMTPVTGNIESVIVTIVDGADPNIIIVDTSVPVVAFDAVSGTDKWRLNEALFPLFPVFLPGSYVMTVTIIDTAGFNASVSSPFRFSAYQPLGGVLLAIPTGQLPNGYVSYGSLNMSGSVDMNSDVVDLLSVKYKVWKKVGDTWITEVPFGVNVTGYPGNPIFFNKTDHVKTYTNSSIEFDSSLFDGTYQISVLLETTIGDLVYPVPIVGTNSTEFTVVQDRPVIIIDPENPTNVTTYVTETEVRFLGSVTDPNRDLVESTLFYDITGVASNELLVLNETNEFDFSIAIGVFTQYENEFTIRARDSKMPITTFVEGSRMFFIDVSAPAVSLNVENDTGDSPLFFKTGNTITIEASILDSIGLVYANYSIVNVETDEVVHSKTFTVDGTPEVLETFQDSISIDNTSVFDVPTGQDVVYQIEWNASNTNDRASRTVSTFIVDKRDADIIPLVENVNLVTFETSPASLLVSMNPPTGLTLTSVGYRVLKDDEIEVLSGIPTLVSGVVHEILFNLSSLPLESDDYLLLISATLNNDITKEVSLRVKLERDPPILNLLNETLTVLLPEQDVFKIVAEVTDPNGDLESVQVRLDKTDLFAPSTGTLQPMVFKNGRYELDFDVSGIFGSWTVFIFAADSSGLESFVTMEITRITPEIQIDYDVLEPRPFQNVEANFTIRVNVTNGMDVLGAMEYRIPDLTPAWKGIPLVSFSEDHALFEVIVNASALPIGKHFLEFRATKFDNTTFEVSLEIVKIPEPSDLGAPVLAEPVVNNLNIDLSWTEVEGAITYQVFRSTENFTDVLNATLVATVNGTSYSEKVDTNGTYYYAVIAIDEQGRGPSSNVVMAVATKPPVGFFQQIINFFIGLVSTIVAFIVSLFPLIINRKKRAVVDCLKNPDLDGCKA